MEQNNIEYSPEQIMKEALETIVEQDSMSQELLKNIARIALYKVDHIEAARKQKADKEAAIWEDQREAMFNAWKKNQDGTTGGR